LVDSQRLPSNGSSVALIRQRKPLRALASSLFAVSGLGGSILNTASSHLPSELTRPVVWKSNRHGNSGMKKVTETVEDLVVGDRPLDLEKVKNTLEEDIPNLLTEEPHWDIFADDFKVLDRYGRVIETPPPGPKLENLKNSKRAINLLRNTYQDRDITTNVEIERGKKLVTARWRVKFATLRDPALPFMWLLKRRRLSDSQNQSNVLSRLLKLGSSSDNQNEINVFIEAETVFRLNNKNKVDSVQIERWLVNGRPFQIMPELNWAEGSQLKQLFDWAKGNLNQLKLQQWAWEIAETPALNPKTYSETVRALSEAGIKRARLLQIAATSVMRLWQGIARKILSTMTASVGTTGAKLAKKWSSAVQILDQMLFDLDFADASSTQVLALVSNQGNGNELDDIDDVYAIALVNKRALIDEDGELGRLAEEQGVISGEEGRVPVVEIGEVVASPNQWERRGLGKELLLRIARLEDSRALVTIVPVNEKLEKYYGSIGFARIDTFGRTMFFRKPFIQETDLENEFELGRLLLPEESDFAI
jgi:hypothetical protein